MLRIIGFSLSVLISIHLIGINCFAQSTKFKVFTNYDSLARLSPNSRNSKLDLQNFDLSQMNPIMLKKLEIKPVYLQLPPEYFILKPFPANSSIQTKAEIEVLLKIQKNRTSEELAYASYLGLLGFDPSVSRSDTNQWKYQANMLFQFIGKDCYRWFKPDSLPLTTDLLAKVWQDCSYYMWALKFRHNRIRPWQLDDRIKIIQNPNFPAYPSGHTAFAFVIAYVLCDLVPQKCGTFKQEAYDIMYSREVLGVHFASDNTAAKDFALQFYRAIKRNNSYLEDLKRSKQELLLFQKE